MRRYLLSLLLLPSLLLTSSCSTKRSSTQGTSSLSGEWIVRSAGTQWLQPSGLSITFAPDSNRISGRSSSCNAFTGKLQTLEAGTLQIDRLATTLAMCPDDSTSQILLSQLVLARSYTIDADGRLQLHDQEARPIAELIRPDQVTHYKRTAIGSSYSVVTIGDLSLSDYELTSPATVFFDLEAKRISGSLSCNSYSAAVEWDEAQPQSLRVGPVMSTRMACPEMSIESAMVASLAAVRYFDYDTTGTLRLLDAQGQPLITMVPTVADTVPSTH